MRLSKGISALVGAALTIGLTAAPIQSAGAAAAPTSLVFRSRPDLQPPKLTVSGAGSLPAGTQLLTTPHDQNFQPSGATIYDAAGNVVWVGPKSHDALSLTRINYKGQDALTFFQGPQVFVTGGFAGTWPVYNTSYQQIGTIAAQNGLLADAHDIQVTPDGRHALVEIYKRTTMNLYQLGYPGATSSDTADLVLDPVLQEIDLYTGNVTWQWDALAAGVGLDESYSPISPFSTPPTLDYFHTNSIGYSPDGQTIFIGGRHVSAIYAIRKSDGKVLWKFGGDVADPSKPKHAPNGAIQVACDTSRASTPCHYPQGQHDAREESVSSDGKTVVISAYDNGFSFDQNLNRGAGVGRTWTLNFADPAHPTAKDATDLGPVKDQSQWALNIVGSDRPLPGGGRLVSFGNSGYIDAYDAAGQRTWQALFEGQTDRTVYYSYRTLPTTNWVAWPAEAPRLAMDYSSGTPVAYASWNGATSVRQWVLLAGPDASHLRAVGQAARTGFETAITGSGATADDAVFVVQALDGTGTVRGTSQVDPIQSRFVQLGGPAGGLGTPQGAQLAGPNGSWTAQRYANGYIVYVTGTPGAIAVAGAIGQRYVVLGGPTSFLGLPLAEQSASADRVGAYVNFQGGAITWSPSAGAHETHGAIRLEWAATGFEFGVLGYPTSDETGSADGVGRYNTFQGGAITWSPSAGAHETHGPIRDEWAATGFEFGVLGYPTSDTTRSGDGIGSYSNFENGAISYSPGTGAHETHGPIRTAWGNLGFEFGVLGYPTSDTTRSGDGVGFYSNFVGGAISWDGSTSDAAHATYGPIRAAWAATGFEFGRLGYPVENPHPVGNGVVQQDFQHGYIQLLPDGSTPVTYY